MAYHPETHHRRTIRLKGYDYAQAGAYFVTICAYQRTCLFGHVENGTVMLSQYGHLAEQCWKVLSRDFPRVELDVFVVMPNHLHGIIILTGRHTAGRGEAFARRRQERPQSTLVNASPLRSARGTQPGSLAAIVQNFKSVSTRKINRIRATPAMPVWQGNYYEHIIRDEDELSRIREYIVNNPLQWAVDRENPSFRATHASPLQHPKDAPWRV
ncbi:MAG: transposase [Deltaproteobacteria bacterium]|nr:transposase [Deltaproteobacteria bacterium]